MSPRHSSITLTSPDTEQDWAAYQTLRWNLLRAPWLPGQPALFESPDRPNIEHVIAKHETGAVIGCGRLHWLGQGHAQIRAMAVHPDFQGTGLGRRLLQRLEQLARGRGVTQIKLQARQSAVAFYQRCGYVVTGAGETLFETIPHQWMAKAVDCHDFSDFELIRRNAHNSDGPMLAQFVFDILAEYNLAPELDGIDRDLENPADTYAKGFFEVLLDQQGTLVATCAMLPHSAEHAELRRMYLAPAWRGRGLGRACLGHALAWAREHGFSQVSLETATVLKQARELYTWAGFIPECGDMAAQRCDLRLVLPLA